MRRFKTALVAGATLGLAGLSPFALGQTSDHQSHIEVWERLKPEEKMF